MSVETPPSTATDGPFEPPPPTAKAWSPIPITIDHPTGTQERTFVPLGAPPVTAQAVPTGINDVGAIPASRTVNDASFVNRGDAAAPAPIAQRYEEGPSIAAGPPQSTATNGSSNASTSALPQRVRRLGPVDAGAIQPTGPLPRNVPDEVAAVRFFPDAGSTAPTIDHAHLLGPTTETPTFDQSLPPHAKRLPTRQKANKTAAQPVAVQPQPVQPQPLQPQPLQHQPVQQPATQTTVPPAKANPPAAPQRNVSRTLGGLGVPTRVEPVTNQTVQPNETVAPLTHEVLTQPVFVAEQPSFQPTQSAPVDPINDPPIDRSLIAGVATTPPPASRHAQAPMGLTGLAPVGHAIPQEVFPNAPKLVTQTNTEAYDFGGQNGGNYGERSTDLPVTMVLPHATARSTSSDHAVSSPGPVPHAHGDHGVGVIDWRFFGLLVVLLSYLPLAFRTLLASRSSSPLSLASLAFFMVPMSFVVVAARRPRRATRERRPLDLALGSALAIASLVCSLVLPSRLGGSASIWRPDWLALPLALGATYVLLWGIGFARELRNTLIVAALAGPVAFVGLLGRSWSPLSGSINPLAEKLLNFVSPLTTTGFAQYSVGTKGTLIDARGLISGRALVAVLLVLIVALVLSSRVEQRVLDSGGRRSVILQRAKKIGVLLASLATYWLAELIVTGMALVVASLVPTSIRSYVTSPVVGALPTLITAYALLGWVRRFGLYLPGNLGMLNAATRLPAHGPASNGDHALTIGAIAIISVVGVLVGIRGSGDPLLALAGTPNPTQRSTVENWQITETVQLDSMHAYFGAKSTWSRTGLQGSASSGLEQVYIDWIDAPAEAVRTFGPSSTFQLGTFVPAHARIIDLGGGRTAIQETYYDESTRSVWSLASVLVTDGTGTHRVVMSATGIGDQAIAPIPAPSATKNLLTRTPRTGAVGTEWKDEKVAATSDALLALFRSYVDTLQSASIDAESSTGFETGADDELGENVVDGLVTSDPLVIEVPVVPADPALASDGFVQ